MFVINKDASIYVTRGDSCVITVTAKEGEEDYTFKAGDILRIKVFEKKACHCVVVQKDFPVVADTLAMDLSLTETETRIGPVISKPVDYWYEVELNPGNNPQTIIGYDDDGPKIFKLFPEGQDVVPDEPDIDPEDIPVVDEELDMLSTRPVQNQAIAKEFHRVSEKINDNTNAIEKNREEDQAHLEDKENPHDVTKEQVGLDKVPNVETNDQTPTFTQAEQFENLVSGEKLSISFGKIMRGLTELISHLANKSNPHNVTAVQLGLGNVDNTSDKDKPVSDAQKTAINEAVTMAENAQTSADNAQTAADNAQEAADNAHTAAENAQTAADNAHKAADNAQTAADNAQVTANSKVSKTNAIAILTVDGWVENIQTVTVAGVTADNTVIVGPDPANHLEYIDVNVRCSDQAEDSLTFACDELPESNLNVNVMILN